MIAALDLGGVLLTDGTKTAFREISHSSGQVSVESLEALWYGELRFPAELGLISSDQVFQQLARVSGLSETRVAELLLGEFREMPEGVAFVREAVERGVRLVLATNHLAEWLPVWADRFEWFSLIDDVVCSSGIGERKPDLPFYEAVRSRATGSSPIPFVDDDPLNVAAANDAGMVGILAESGWSRRVWDLWRTH